MTKDGATRRTVFKHTHTIHQIQWTQRDEHQLSHAMR